MLDDFARDLDVFGSIAHGRLILRSLAIVKIPERRQLPEVVDFLMLLFMCAAFTISFSCALLLVNDLAQPRPKDQTFKGCISASSIEPITRNGLQDYAYVIVGFAILTLVSNFVRLMTAIGLFGIRGR